MNSYLIDFGDWRELKLQKKITVKNVFTDLPLKTESNAHFNKNSNLTKKYRKINPRVTFECNAYAGYIRK